LPRRPVNHQPIDVRFDHLGIAVKDIDTAIGFFARALPVEMAAAKSPGFSRDFNRCSFHVGQFKIVLIEAAHADSAVRRFIAQRGEGMHHVCLKTAHLDALVARLEAEGLRVVDRRITPGGGATAAISRRSTHGVMFRLWQAAQTLEPERPTLIPYRLRSGEVIQLYVDHISVAVRDLETTLNFFHRHFPVRAVAETHPGYDGTFRFTSFFLDTCRIEVIAQDAERPSGFVTRFLARRGEGLHHLSIDVDRLDPLLAQLEADGVRIVDRASISDHWKTAFISPRSAHGVLIQFWQTPYFGNREP
jgi:methylmalonyl-CoA/ethylmalonyl-CoA epimerase